MKRGVCVISILIVGGLIFWWLRSEPETPDGVSDSAMARISLSETDKSGLSSSIDAKASGWHSEEFAAAANEQLALLAQILEGEAEVDEGELASLVTADVSFALPSQPGLEEVYAHDDLRVARVRGGEERLAGISEFAVALGQFRKQLWNPGSTVPEITLKTIGIEMGDGSVKSVAKLESKSADHSLSQHRFLFDCVWQSQGDASQPMIRELIVTSGESTVAARGEPWFSDCTEAALGQNATAGELKLGMHDLLQRIGRVHGMLYFQRHGLAVGDANGDGLDDVYLCQPAGMPNKLFIHQKDGTARDQSTEFGVDWLDNTASALFVDLDNDGDQDLALATFEGVRILENREGEKFLLKAKLRSEDVDLHALSAVDYDNDGDLDLYVTVDFAAQAKQAFLYHDANDGGRNTLFRNDRKFTFVNVTNSVGLGENNNRHSLAAAWEDYDNDGDQDLYVANDYGQNCLYRNDGSRFSEVAAQAGVVDYGSGMSASWADYDRNGTMDLYVGNMFSAAGSRITTQARFLPNARPEVRSLYRNFVRGNSCYRNLGDSFEEVGDVAGVRFAHWSWSSIFSDLNNDGWEDLVVANGYITTPDTGDL